MTYIRRQLKNGHIYLYSMRSYRDKKTIKVRQEAHYIGKEVKREGEKIIIPPLDRTFVIVFWNRDHT